MVSSVARLRLKRESGENPELPRSGKQERTLQTGTGRLGWEAEASRKPAESEDLP
jgi:hypothetical protein